MSAGVVPDGKITISKVTIDLVGAGLPAMAVCQSSSMLAMPTPSLASQLPQGLGVFWGFQALAGTGLAQGENPTAQTGECQFHTSSSAGVGL